MILSFTCGIFKWFKSTAQIPNYFYWDQKFAISRYRLPLFAPSAGSLLNFKFFTLCRDTAQRIGQLHFALIIYLFISL